MKLVYIAGPFRANSAWDVEQNIRAAEELALECWRRGVAVICPHTNTRFFQGAAPDEIWLKGDLEMLRRSDAVMLTANWRQSSGARAEVDLAKELGLPVFERFCEFEDWLSKTCSNCGYIYEDLTLKERTWTCPRCNTKHDRDINAAINIHRVGASTLGLDDVRPALVGNHCLTPESL